MRVLGIDPGTAIVGYSIIDNSKKNLILTLWYFKALKKELYGYLRYFFFQKSEEGYKSWSGKRSDHACRTKK